MAKKKAAPRTRRAATVRPPDAAGPELIVILASDEAGETPPPVARQSRSGASRGAGLARVMRRAGATLQPLFGVTAERVVAERDAASRRALLLRHRVLSFSLRQCFWRLHVSGSHGRRRPRRGGQAIG